LDKSPVTIWLSIATWQRSCQIYVANIQGQDI